MTKFFPGSRPAATFLLLLLVCLMAGPSRAFLVTFHHNNRQDALLRGAQSDSDNPPFPAGFNPLKYNASVNNNRAPSSSTVISLRQTQMKQVMADLLLHANDPVQRQSILNENVDFLLEPILDEDCVQEDDSIYLNCRTVTERFAAFDAQLAQRLTTARDPAVQTVLQALRDFVMQQQPQQEQSNKRVFE